ncbi:Elongation factor Ts [Leucobacter aridicollis]|uniref:Elongation factor Ts n=1 Tax=Leucobacter aridicollis TaxID=283878 RepID=A0A852R3B4_9MICO|nr:translation elongation factor Ts [Leucobacter aridicollis]MBL3681784.1 elongation factor Ts [Leucobacter aridicollis]MCS3427992.1 elongation factor Ts [Leucobacter aridicollis]NYD27177.1 elongation factor Ts [Leucobacter aridicollis]RKQ94744.1 elongation factor Ts [Mycolicibacterium mucogenicum 261Sha1.1M5]
MAAVSMAAVKELRERLGAGMVDSKNALVEAEGDIEKAIEILRLKGLKGVAKRGDREASEGLVAAKQSEGAATMIELVCETDFVAKNEKFLALSEQVLDALVAAGAKNAEEGLAAPAGDKTVADLITDEAAIIGERIELRRVERIEAPGTAVYLHRTSKDLPPQIGVVVGFEGGDEKAALSIAQHISFAEPLFVNRDEVPEADVDKERDIVTEISKNEGKPEAALPKIIEGRLNAFFKQVVLNEQVHALDAEKRDVAKVAEAAGIKVTGFSRCKVGA